jgi:hypothetical protein
MEISYIWVEKFRDIIDHLNLNFQHQGKHRFSYLDGQIVVSPNPESPLDFGDNITGITAIAGRNGSGKSTICEMVLHAAATYVNGGLSYYLPFKGIICFGDKIFYSEHLTLGNQSELRELGYEVQQFKDTPFERVPLEWRQDFHKGSFIYYNNALDWRADIDLNNLTNISTQFLLANDYRTGTALVPSHDDPKERPDFFIGHKHGCRSV